MVFVIWIGMDLRGMIEMMICMMSGTVLLNCDLSCNLDSECEC